MKWTKREIPTRDQSCLLSAKRADAVSAARSMFRAAAVKLNSSVGTGIVFAMVVFMIASIFSMMMVQVALNVRMGDAAQQADEQAYLASISAARLMQNLINDSVPCYIAECTKYEPIYSDGEITGFDNTKLLAHAYILTSDGNISATVSAPDPDLHESAEIDSRLVVNSAGIVYGELLDMLNKVSTTNEKQKKTLTVSVEDHVMGPNDTKIEMTLKNAQTLTLNIYTGTHEIGNDGDKIMLRLNPVVLYYSLIPDQIYRLIPGEMLDVSMTDVSPQYVLQRYNLSLQRIE